jgi:hypothetical protein
MLKSESKSKSNQIKCTSISRVQPEAVNGCNLSRSYLREANGNALKYKYKYKYKTLWAARGCSVTVSTRLCTDTKPEGVCRSTPFQLGNGINGTEIPGFCVPRPPLCQQLAKCNNLNLKKIDNARQPVLATVLSATVLARAAGAGPRDYGSSARPSLCRGHVCYLPT